MVAVTVALFLRYILEIVVMKRYLRVVVVIKRYSPT